MDMKEIDFDAHQFGERVRTLRVQKGWSTSKLADEADISRPYMWQLEEGRSTPSLGYASRIARALNVQVDDLFGVSKEIPEQLLRSDLTHFWNFLCERAATVQKVFRLEREFPIHKWYKFTLEGIDRSILKSDVQDDCIQQVMDAIQTEMNKWGDDSSLNKSVNNGKGKDSIQAWKDAIALAESKTERREALLPLYWNLGNALYGPGNYRYLEAFDALRTAEVYLDTSKIDLPAKAGFNTTLGWVSYYSGEFIAGEKSFRKVKEYLTLLPEDTLTNRNNKFNNLSGVNRGLAAIYQRQMRFTEAEQYFQYALEDASKVKDDFDGQIQLIWVNFRIGSFYRFVGDLQKGQKFLESAKELLNNHLTQDGEDDFGRSALMTMILNNLADLIIRRGENLDTAQRYLDESQKISKTIGDPRSLAYSYLFHARFFLVCADWDKALFYLDEAAREFQRMKIPRYLDEIQITRAKLYYSLALHEASKGVIDAIDETQNQDMSIQSLVGLTRVIIYSLDGKGKLDSKKMFENYLQSLRPMQYDYAEGLLEYAKYLYNENNKVDSLKRFNDALKICKHRGYIRLTTVITKLIDEMK